MPFRLSFANWSFGINWWGPFTAYCQTNSAAPDYGKCYNTAGGKAVFVLSTGTPACVSDNTCINVSPASSINLSSNYAIDLRGVGKQAILHELSIIENTNNTSRPSFSPIFHSPFMSVVLDGAQFERNIFTLYMPNVRSTNWQGYDPQSNWFGATNFFATPPVGTQIFAKIVTTRFFQQAYPVLWNLNTDNVYSASFLILIYSFEASPLAVIPLDYVEYIKYPELRNVFGYNSNGVEQPGWNADDIIRVLREIFPDRAWAVYDDKTYTLYLYNLTPDYVPDWLIEKLTPVAVKVLQSPSDSSIAKYWLDKLNSRNTYSQPPAEII